MSIARLTTSSLCLAAALLASIAPTAAQEKVTRPSTKIAAFGDDPAPAPARAPTPAPAPVAPEPKVVLGAVIPPAPHVEVAAEAPGRPYDGRRGALGGFVAHPAVATRFAVNSPFGVRSDPITGMLRMHTGVDLKAAYGESVGAAMSGTVCFAGERSGYGNLVVLDHGSGIATFYAHLARIDVATGQTLAAGQLIGYVGTTGRSTGPHLHYEVRANGHPVDPSATIGIAGDRLVVNGQSLGAVGDVSPAALPKAPGGTSIARDWGADDGTVETSGGQTLSIDWE